MDYVNNVLHRIDRLKPTGENKWQAPCPAHDDKSPSLSIKDTGSSLLVYCHAGCTCSEITAAIGLKPKDLFPPSEKSASIRKEVATRHKLEEYQILLLMQLCEVSDRIRGEKISRAQRKEILEARKKIKRAWEYL